ncbi:MAG: prephenate dehydratase [Verrucomicrobiae bacterium]|nr:prephenate dehydratase [Verrucomicrobiae bacterium]MCP5551715.1 prephenate dehydratase [Akkermansiaceae bacterium]
MPAAFAMTITDSTPVAYLGPEGSFSHLVARTRFGEARELVPRPSVDEVFDYLEGEPETVAIVPIENSSGGIITATVDRILRDDSPFFILEEIALNVKLALLGRENEAVTKIYSHFAPFHHCEKWLKAHYPRAEQIVAPSTSNAVIFASQEPGAAAIGPRDSAERYGLSVLHYPIAAEVPNITQFFVVAHSPNASAPENARTSLAVVLPDSSGSLFRFLEPFAKSAVNLKRIESRPIAGQPNKYRFFVELDGNHADPKVEQALEMARAVSLRIRNLGSYPASARFES